ncbi:MAG: 2,3-bisphosphoglycerate-independent phosphoglycerate mutase, partial [Bacteroidetes bacterium]|nr:2,3-bisphosphoglycerate-independent phosphoglycerate mutase [Bacteroidota bacterium]
MNDKKIILIIMDCWGLGKIKKSDAIQHAKVPFVDSLYNQYPNNTLVACGQAVGLPDGKMGNSAVGHLNLGAGRIVYQELERVNQAIKTGELQSNPQILAAINYAQQNNRKLHLLGLLSDGGVHSHIHHLKAIVSVCAQKKLQNVFVHAFTDGRDTDPKSGMGFIGDLQNHLNKTTGKIASVTGRYFAMDRDKRWERIKIAYEALVNGTGAASNNILESILASYQSNVTDEFIMPIINTACNGKIEAHDAVICFNFRTDRCREITQVLTQKDMPEYQMKTLPLQYTTMTVYDHTFKNVNTVFQNDDLKQTLGEVLSAAGKTQLRIAETEKYPHVSFFFSGGREVPFEGEKRSLVQSPKVATYDLQPEMSALGVKNAVIYGMDDHQPDFICVNFANTDMVGHTGDFKAAMIAAQTVDGCVIEI